LNSFPSCLLGNKEPAVNTQGRAINSISKKQKAEKDGRAVSVGEAPQGITNRYISG